MDNILERGLRLLVSYVIFTDAKKDAKSSQHEMAGSTENIPLTEQSMRSNDDTLPRENGGDVADGGQSAPKKSHRKEKSVLQAKLTKLAVQIGYAGKRCYVSATFGSELTLLCMEVNSACVCVCDGECSG